MKEKLKHLVYISGSILQVNLLIETKFSPNSFKLTNLLQFSAREFTISIIMVD